MNAEQKQAVVNAANMAFFKPALDGSGCVVDMQAAIVAALRELAKNGSVADHPATLKRLADELEVT